MHNYYTLHKNVQAKHVRTCPFEIYVYIHVCGGGMGGWQCVYGMAVCLEGVAVWGWQRMCSLASSPYILHNRTIF